MTISFLHYDLLNGFIQNWLVAGPQACPVEKIEGTPDLSTRQEIAKQFYVPALEIKIQPVERGKLTEGNFTIGDYQGSWEYFRCQEDHLVNHSGSYLSAQYLRSWAFTQVECQQEMDIELRLTSPGAADLWMNHKHLLRKEPSESPHHRTAFRLSRGTNKIYLRFENLAIRDCAHFAALQICLPDGTPLADAENISISIPTGIMPRLLELRNHMEQLFAGVSLEQDALQRDQKISLHLPDEPSAAEVVTIRLMNPDRIIFRDGAIEGKPAQRIPLNTAFELTSGRYQIELLPRVWEYYELGMRIKKDIPFWTVGNASYSAERYGSDPERRREALLKAVEQRSNLYAEMAKMALNFWNRIDLKTIFDAVEQVNLRLDGSVLRMTALIGILYRFSDNTQFPEEIRPVLETCIMNYRYRQDEPGYDAQNYSGDWQKVLFYTCELLAGQRFPKENFTNSGWIGQQHVQKAGALIRSWISARAQRGFEDWGSSEELTCSLIALSLLVDLVEDESLQELAMVLMDKIFFTLALNTYRGILGAPQKRVSPTDLMGGILQPTIGITRLMWGMGVFNHRIDGYVSLACMEQYELPAILSDIAANLPQEMWNREQHASRSADGFEDAVNKVAYRTPDYMLSSAQDYQPGANGGQEHIWQATLDASAIVFVNNPGCSFQEKGMIPGYWVGNAHLPRIGQWKNAIIAIYNLPDDDWMGFTHAYFPTFDFDEYEIREQWAFACKGSSYLAITASSGIQLITQGPHSYRELRAPGRQVVWICHMGRAVLDGDFSSFKQKILEHPLQYDGLSVRCTTIQGEELSFGYEGPFLCNGSEVPLCDFPNYENPYSVTPLNASQMDIVVDDSVLRLDFSAQPEE